MDLGEVLEKYFCNFLPLLCLYFVKCFSKTCSISSYQIIDYIKFNDKFFILTFLVIFSRFESIVRLPYELIIPVKYLEQLQRTLEPKPWKYKEEQQWNNNWRARWIGATSLQIFNANCMQLIWNCNRFTLVLLSMCCFLF